MGANPTFAEVTWEKLVGPLFRIGLKNKTLHQIFHSKMAFYLALLGTTPCLTGIFQTNYS